MKPKLLFLVTEDWYFVSHRLALACAAKEAGYDVLVVTQVTDHGEEIINAGLKLEPLKFSRSHGKPWQDLMTIISIFRLYKKYKPDLVHHVSIKPVIYGSIAALFARVPVVINALTGLGFVFSSTQAKAKLLRVFIQPLLRMLLSRKNAWLIVQNPDDRVTLRKAGIINNEQFALIRGSGVDRKKFWPVNHQVGNKPSPSPIVLLAARMLWDKGVGEFVGAANILKASGREVRFVLVGDLDSENPACIPYRELLKWQAAGIVEWWGRRDDMPEILGRSTLVCLPSYREGLPKVLIEAAACGKAIVTTDVPGCREIVQHAVNGYLVPIKDAKSLADAIEALLNNKYLREEMGRKSREIFEQEFTVEKVINETLELYSRALSKEEKNGNKSLELE